MIVYLDDPADDDGPNGSYHLKFFHLNFWLKVQINEIYVYFCEYTLHRHYVFKELF